MTLAPSLPPSLTRPFIDHKIIIISRGYSEETQPSQVTGRRNHSPFRNYLFPEYWANKDLDGVLVGSETMSQSQEKLEELFSKKVSGESHRRRRHHHNVDKRCPLGAYSAALADI
jgi:hypothetical protein